MPTPNLKRQFVWTVIPAGRVEPIAGEEVALFALLLTPRLLGPQAATLTVADFGMQAWPQRLAAARFETLRSATPVVARKVPLVTADGGQVTFSVAEQQAAWRALFPDTTLVRPYQQTSYSGRPVREFPASAVGAQISRVYGDSARVLAEYGGNTREDTAQRRSALDRITDDWQAGLWPTTSTQSATSTEPSALRRAYDFYRREPADFTPIASLGELAPEELDFHDIVARLADHPVLLRVLGLLIDFAAPATQLAGTATNELHVIPRWPSPDTSLPAGWHNATHEDLSPRTAYTLANSRFVPSAPGGPAGAPPGLLPLAGAGTSSRFEVMPFDVDGAALRMVSIAASDRDQPPFSPDAAPALPTLRSVGFALVEKTRTAEHARRLSRAEQRATVNGLLGSALSADNLVAGYRVDILDATTRQWRSLCQRRVRYTIGNIQIGQAAGGVSQGLLEEGYVRPDSLTTGAGASDAVYVHQTVARWDGWSLVAPRPERVPDPIAAPQQPFTLHVDIEPGSLPRLRFGRDYRLRVRLADLAGGGLWANQVGSAEQQTQPFTHRRFEPIPPPELAPTREYVDGEGQDQLVIRSDRGVSAEDYATTHGYRAYDLRHLFAPKASLELALQHEGKFDAALGPSATSGEVNRLFDIATRADRDFGDVRPPPLLIAGGHDSGDYFVLPETGVTLPWLADPGSRLAAVIVRSRPEDPDTGSRGVTSGFDRLYPWKGTWPNVVPIALRVTAASSGCTATMDVTEDRRTLTIALGPAEQATLDIVSCPSIDDVTVLGVANWAGATSTTTNPVTQNVYRGRNPMVTPPRTITVVHAVQRPLVDPSGRLVATRQAGDTYAVLGTRELQVDLRSTGRIDIRAAWTDCEDNPPNKPAPRKKEMTVGSFDVEHRPLYEALPEIRQEFADTRRRRITYKVTAVSRFRDYFGTITATNSQACTVEGILAVTDVPSSARPPAPTLRYLMPTFRWSREGEGTTVLRSTRRGGGLRAFLDRPWFVSGADEALAVLAWPQSTSAPPATALRHISLAGRDPTWDTGSPHAVLNPSHFNAASSPSESLPESGQTVSAVRYPVHFDEDADCWYADIDLSPVVESSYFPFVRLGLARYQANCVHPIARLSPPILSDPIQILPHRELTVRRSTGRASVTVSGTGPSAGRPTTIQAELEVYEGSLATANDALIGPSGWKMIARKTGLLGSNLDLDIPRSGSRPMRISVAETESFPAHTSLTTPITDRLVYADIIPLTPIST